MLEGVFELKVINTETRDGAKGKYQIITLMGPARKPFQIFSKDIMILELDETYLFEISISVGQKTYLNILSVKAVA